MTLAFQSRTRCLAEKTCRRSSGGWLTCPTVAEFGFASRPNAQTPYGIFFSFSSSAEPIFTSSSSSLPNGIVIPSPGSPIGRGGDPPDLLFSAPHWSHLVSADKGSPAIGQTPQAPTHPCPGPQAAVSALLCSLSASRTKHALRLTRLSTSTFSQKRGSPTSSFIPRYEPRLFPRERHALAFNPFADIRAVRDSNLCFPRGPFISHSLQQQKALAPSC